MIRIKQNNKKIFILLFILSIFIFRAGFLLSKGNLSFWLTKTLKSEFVEINSFNGSMSFNLDFSLVNCDSFSEQIGEYTPVSRSDYRSNFFVDLGCLDRNDLLNKYSVDHQLSSIPTHFFLTYLNFLHGDQEKGKAFAKKAIGVEQWFFNQGRYLYEVELDRQTGINLLKLALIIDSQVFEIDPAFLRLSCLHYLNTEELINQSLDNPCVDFDAVVNNELSKILLARLAFQNNELTDAISYAKEAVAINPSSGSAYYWLALTNFELGNERDAFDLLITGIRSDNKYALNYIELAKLLGNKGCYQQLEQLTDFARQNLTPTSAFFQESYLDDEVSSSNCDFPPFTHE